MGQQPHDLNLTDVCLMLPSRLPPTQPKTSASICTALWIWLLAVGAQPAFSRTSEADRAAEALLSFVSRSIYALLTGLNGQKLSTIPPRSCNKEDINALKNAAFTKQHKAAQTIYMSCRLSELHMVTTNSRNTEIV